MFTDEQALLAESMTIYSSISSSSEEEGEEEMEQVGDDEGSVPSVNASSEILDSLQPESVSY